MAISSVLISGRSGSTEAGAGGAAFATIFVKAAALGAAVFGEAFLVVFFAVAGFVGTTVFFAASVLAMGFGVTVFFGDDLSVFMMCLCGFLDCHFDGAAEGLPAAKIWESPLIVIHSTLHSLLCQSVNVN